MADLVIDRYLTDAAIRVKSQKCDQRSPCLCVRSSDSQCHAQSPSAQTAFTVIRIRMFLCSSSVSFGIISFWPSLAPLHPCPSLPTLFPRSLPASLLSRPFYLLPFSRFFPHSRPPLPPSHPLAPSYGICGNRSCLVFVPFRHGRQPTWLKTEQ